MLTNEELTYPRFKVLVDYPGAQFHVGQVLLFNHKEEWFTGKPEWTLEPTITRQGGKTQIYIGSIEPFTQVFKRLEWFEERTQDEMPRYIKYKDNGNSYIEKLLAHNPDIETDKLPHFRTKRLEHGLYYHNTSAEPATRHEWQKFIQKNNPHLIPRYIVQLEYPDSPYPLNKVLTNPTGKELKLVMGFPKIFRKLMWYEMRTPSQLPEYLRNSGSGVIYKASYPTTETVQLEDIFGNTALAKFTNLEPASVEEWDDYKENKTESKATLFKMLA
jgi:hypothetical protein